MRGRDLSHYLAADLELLAAVELQGVRDGLR